PYADAEIVTLLVGSDALRFDVHGTLLKQSPVLATEFFLQSANGRQQLKLPEIEASTAHTLVHYLYTSTYQALNATAQAGISTLFNYKLSTCVYCAAISYKLPGLAELAKDKIATFGEGVSISHILSVARDHAFPALAEDETWYSDYLQDVIKRAMAEDPEPFRRPDFITQIQGNSKLLQVVWTTVVSDLAAGPSTAQPASEEVATPVAETVSSTDELKPEDQEEVMSEEVREKAAVDESPQVLAANDDASDAPYAESTTTLNTTQEEVYKLDDIEPTVETLQTLEPFTDEIGFEKSKMYQMGKKEAGAELQSPVATEQERLSHNRSDSVMQAEENAVDPDKTEAGEIETVEEVIPLVVNGSGEAAAVSKTKKKSKKKKNSIVF
ncbi:hypothetical protein EK21DRAFT_62247, partial [Setomelanomma holmii]